MAVKLPTRDSLGGLPSVRTARNARIASADFSRGRSGVGTGMVTLGAGIDKVAQAASLIEEQNRKREEFEAEQAFQKFDWDQRLAVDQSMRNMQPGQARDFAEQTQKSYFENASEFMKTVPDHLKPKMEGRLFATERDLYGSATTFARGEQKRFATQTIDDTAETIYRPKARVTPTEQLDTVSGEMDRLVDANPDLTPIEKDQIKTKHRREIGKSHLDALPPDKAQAVIASRVATPEALLRKFEGFREGAYFDVNAHRVGYGSDTVTRPDGTIEKVTPQTRVTREDAERDLSRRTKEFAATAEKQVGTDVWAALPDNARAGLVSVAYNYGSLPKSVVAAVQTGNPGNIASAVGALPANPDRRRQEADIIRGYPAALRALTDEDWKAAETGARVKTERFAKERSEVYERQIIDAGIGRGPLFDRSAIENDGILDEPRRNTLLRQYDSAAGDVVGVQNFMNRMFGKDPGISAANGQDPAPFNPYDQTEKKYADAAFVQLGGDRTALQTVVEKTGIVPKSAATALRADINSTDPGRVSTALTVASNMLSSNQNVFASVENKSDFENSAVTFRHYVDDLGLTAEEAAKKLIKERSPEYQAQKNARIKAENVDDLIKKKLSIDDLRSQFDSSWGWMRNPQVEFSPGGRAELYQQYAEQVKERYLETGDWSLAKKLAGDSVKRVWGVTNVNGSAGLTGGGTVMQYPPERAPAYAGIENISDKFAQHAIETIKAETGANVKRENLRIAPVPRVTASQYKSGEAPQYSLSWQDDKGNVQMLSPGKAFWVDPAALRQSQTAQRREAYDRKAAAATAARPLVQSTMAPFMPQAGGEDTATIPKTPEYLPSLSVEAP